MHVICNFSGFMEELFNVDLILGSAKDPCYEKLDILLFVGSLLGLLVRLKF